MSNYSLKGFIYKISEANKLGLDNAQCDKIYQHCVEAGYSEILESAESEDIKDIVCESLLNLNKTNPLTALAGGLGISCPMGNEAMEVVALSDDREVFYCSKHRLAIPMESN